MRFRFTIVIAALLSCVIPAFAQPLADRVPDDAMIYLGWRGTDQLGTAYEQSHLKAVVDATDWRQTFDEFLPALLAKAGEQDAEAAEVLRLATSLGRSLWRHETAFYFGGLIAGQRDGSPSPKLALLIRAGDDAQPLAAQLNASLRNAAEPPPFPIRIAAYGDLVAISTGAWPGFEALLGDPAAGAPPAPALKTNPRFTAALAHVQPDPACTIYIDAEAIVKMVDGFVALGAAPEQQQVWRKARKLTGIAGVHQLIFTGGFEGPDWISRGFLAARAPRQGLLALLDAEPLPDDVLKLIPQDALVASAGRFDLARLLSQSRASAAAADPQWAQTVDDALQRANNAISMDLEKDLLAPLGPDWAFYVSPSVGGNGLLGLCIVNRPRDPRKTETALATLAQHANDFIRRQTDNEPTIAFKSRQVDGRTLHYLAVPLVTPTWTVADGNLYLALYPQVVLSAANHAQRQGPSILANEKFLVLRKRLDALAPGAARPRSIAFADLPRTAPNAYGSWLAISRYAGVADLFGIDSPLMLLPPIDRLMPHLAPAGQTTWVDDAGWHLTAVAPFPGADLLAQDPLATLMTAQPAIMAGILVPSLNRARETANRVQSASNLRQIGIGMLLYSNEHGNKYPPTLGEVYATQDLAPEIFVAPGSSTTVPNGLSAEDYARWINEHADYVYLAAGKPNNLTAEDIVAYERPEIRGRDGFNVLFGDVHVAFLTYDAGMKLIQDQKATDPAP